MSKMKKVAAGSRAYTLDTETCFGRGIIWLDKELDDALEHRVYDLFFDVEGQKIVKEMLLGVIETVHQRDNLDHILSCAYDDDFKDYDVGEVLAEAYLIDHCDCYFPWSSRDDKRQFQASLPGADLVGFKTDENGDVFAFGEVKTSTQTIYPPSVMQGEYGLEQQLKKLRDSRKLRYKLILRYLFKRVQDRPLWFQRYQKAAGRYLKNDTDIHLYGILIRDVNKPREADLQSCVEKLKDGCPKGTQIKLLALYLPEGSIKDLAKTLKRTRDRSLSLLDEIKNHWAVIAAGGYETMKRVELWVNEQRVTNAVGERLCFNFSRDEKAEQSREQVVLAYEMAAVEVLDKYNFPVGNRVLYDQTISACYKVFDIKSLESIPGETNECLFFVLELSATAICGDRGSDIQRWYKENSHAISVPKMENVSWDLRVLYLLFDCWIRLFRKDSWDDLHAIPPIIQGLREEQEIYEKEYLYGEDKRENRRNAMRLIALYHWSKATEILALYMLQGESEYPFIDLDKHFNAALRAAERSDIDLEHVLWWLRATARVMVTNSLWWAIQENKAQMSGFVESLINRKHQPMFELLPPQRAALVEQGFFDPAKTAIVVDMPTSGGKTLLAQFKIIQALNQLENGWVAYVAPTRALVAQITRRLRKDFGPINLRVEQLTPAVEMDRFDEALFSEKQEKFHILVTTPEKLSLVIRNKNIERPLALVVMDEAHNISNEERGLRMELLLATIKHDYKDTKFLLLTPFIKNDDADMIVQWLVQDINKGQSISLGTTPWKPNERIIGIYYAMEDNNKSRGCRLVFEALTTTPKAMQFRQEYSKGGVTIGEKEESNLYEIFKSEGFSNNSTQTAAIASILSTRGKSIATSIAIGSRPDMAWSMAEKAAQLLPDYENVSQDIQLVQRFLRSEMISDEVSLLGSEMISDENSPNDRLIKLLDKGIGVHHAGLPEEVRFLMEWLAENGRLRLICMTTTLAQGLNFPVSSIFLQDYKYYPEGKSKEMDPSDFWNLAGRVGRVGQDSIGIIGLAQGNYSKNQLVNFLKKQIGALVSRLEILIAQLRGVGDTLNLDEIREQEQWEDFRCYVAHLCAEKKRLDEIPTDEDIEYFLRQTYGYTRLRNDEDKKADMLFNVTRDYAHSLVDRAELTDLADLTGLTPEGVECAVEAMDKLGLQPSDWFPEVLFCNKDNDKMKGLFSVMLEVNQLGKHLKKVRKRLENVDKKEKKEPLEGLLADIICDWVNGESLVSITETYFTSDKPSKRKKTTAMTTACQTLYREIINNATWGISALSNIFMMISETLSEVDRQRINTLPSMIYYGVKTEYAVLMRMNAVPRSIAETLGKSYKEEEKSSDKRFSVLRARRFLKGLKEEKWQEVRAGQEILSGQDYKRVWRVLSGKDVVNDESTKPLQRREKDSD